MATLNVLNTQGKKIEEIELNAKLFTERVNTDLLHQAIVMYNACRRQGNASTKERGSVSGGGKKPWQQKGTGRARHGSTRSPLWTHGGVTFGPHPRGFAYEIPRQIRVAALREGVNSKLQAKTLFCIQDVKDKVAKTKDFAKLVKAAEVKGNILAVLDGCEASVLRAARNLAGLVLMRSEDVNARDILSRKNLLVSKTAFNKILKRIQK